MKCYDCEKPIQIHGPGEFKPEEVLCQMCDPCMIEVQGNKWRHDVWSNYLIMYDGKLRQSAGLTAEDACKTVLGCVPKKAKYRNLGRTTLGKLSDDTIIEHSRRSYWRYF